MDISRKEHCEIDYWRTSPTENPDSDSIDSILSKMTEARQFVECCRLYASVFEACGSVLELGAGQGWASCLLKRMHPRLQIAASDISAYAIRSKSKWEHIWRSEIDASFACRSYSIPVCDGAYDCVYCFQAAHHFVLHRESLAEIHRVLRPGGTALYLFEPSCRRFLHRPAHWRVNRKRPEVPEDVLVFNDIRSFAVDAGFTCDITPFPTTIGRGLFESAYYTVLKRSRMLQSLLPCTYNFKFTKKV